MLKDMYHEFTQPMAVRSKGKKSRHTITINSTTTATTMPQNRLVTNTTTSGSNIQVWTLYSPTRPVFSGSRPAGLIASALVIVWSRLNVPSRLQILPAKLILD